MTVTLSYTLTPKARVSAGSSGQVLNTRRVHEILPGSVVRGALGATWWLSADTPFQGADRQARFDALFGARMRIGFAAPPRKQPRVGGAELQAMSWVRCKYPDTAKGCTRGWHDLAAADLKQCPMCRGPLLNGKGWDVPTEWTTAATRTALTAKGTAKDEQLFTRNAMRRTIPYTGTITIDVDPPALAEELDWLTQPMDVSIGGQRSTMGRCRWTCEITPNPAAITPRERLVLRLTSPAILIDRYGAPSMDLAQALADVVQRCGGAGTVRRTWVRPITVSGWHGMAGIPKPEEWAVEAGGAAVLQGWDGPSLSPLSRGIGLRRLEGYGAVDILSVSEVPSLLTPPAVEDPDEAADPTGPIAYLLVLVPPEAHRATLSGLTAAARNVLLTREHGLPPAVVDSRVVQALGLPWARDLAEDARDEVERILRSPSLRTVLGHVLAAQEEAR